MITTTWELHYVAPREARAEMLASLGALKAKYTLCRVDYDLDEVDVHVMVADVEVFKDVFLTMALWGPFKISVQVSAQDGTVHGNLVLDEEGDDSSDLTFPTESRSQ